jgi:hypothetical protein
MLYQIFDSVNKTIDINNLNLIAVAEGFEPPRVVSPTCFPNRLLTISKRNHFSAPSRFELKLTPPKGVVLPLHYRAYFIYPLTHIVQNI